MRMSLDTISHQLIRILLSYLQERVAAGRACVHLGGRGGAVALPLLKHLHHVVHRGDGHCHAPTGFYREEGQMGQMLSNAR
jgi:hypothetical protein